MRYPHQIQAKEQIVGVTSITCGCFHICKQIFPFVGPNSSFVSFFPCLVLWASATTETCQWLTSYSQLNTCTRKIRFQSTITDNLMNKDEKFGSYLAARSNNLILKEQPTCRAVQHTTVVRVIVKLHGSPVNTADF